MRPPGAWVSQSLVRRRFQPSRGWEALVGRGLALHESQGLENLTANRIYFSFTTQ